MFKSSLSVAPLHPVLSLAAATMLVGCVTPAARVATGTYCTRQELVGDTGTGRIPLGDFQMRLDIVERNGRTFVSFRNSMPDSQQILAAEAVEATPQASGALRFEFEDGWGNIGEGQITRGGEVTLTMTRPNSDPLASNIGRNYGTFQLRRGLCEFG